MLTRFLLAGLAMLLLVQQTWVSLPWGILILLVAAFGLFWIEWAFAINAVVKAEEWVLKLVPAARLWLALFSWLVAVPLWVTKRLTGATDPVGAFTEQELKTLVDAAVQDEGSLEYDETRMIHSIFQLGETLAREIMVPRIDMLALEADTSVEGAVQALLESGHSRVPVYDDTVDNTLGLLYSKVLSVLERISESLIKEDNKKLKEFLKAKKVRGEVISLKVKKACCESGSLSKEVNHG